MTFHLYLSSASNMFGGYSHLLSLVFCNEIMSQLQGSAKQMILKFVSIAKMDILENIDNAGVILQENGWNLDKAIAWFYEHKNDDEYRRRLKTKNGGNTEKHGNYDISKFNLFLVNLMEE